MYLCCDQIWFDLEPMLLGLVSNVLHFFLCLIRFVQEFEFLCFFLFNLFLVVFFCVVLESNQDFGLVYGGTKNFGSTQSGRVKKQLGQMVLYFVCFAIFVKGFLGLKVCLAHSFDLCWVVLLQEIMVFCQTKPKK